MKPIQKLFAGIAGLFAALCLGSCGNEAPQTVTASFTVLLVSGENQLLLSRDGSAGNAAVANIADLSVTDSDGNAVPFHSIRPGQIFDLTWDGLILETYPGQIQHISSLALTGEQPDSWVNPIDNDPFFDSWKNPSPTAGLPTLQLETRTETTASCLNVPSGSSDWAGEEVLSVSSPHPLAWSEDRLVFLNRKSGSATLLFSKEPEAVTVLRWDYEKRGVSTSYPDGEEQPLNGNVLALPKSGSFLYEVTANWEEGTVTYVFALREREDA